MTETVLSSLSGVTLVGGGRVNQAEIETALIWAPNLAAADGGAAAAMAAGHPPLAVIGDFDSIPDNIRARIPAERLHHVPEQHSTDFHKCLTRIEAPLIIAVGFSRGRMDHLLAVLNVMVRLPERRTVIFGSEDICVLVPPEIELDLPVGTPVSLFPMGEVTAESEGLEWPVNDLSFAPDGQSGTSNRAIGHVRLVTHAPKMLLLLPRTALAPLIEGLSAAPGW